MNALKSISLKGFGLDNPLPTKQESHRSEIDPSPKVFLSSGGFLKNDKRAFPAAGGAFVAGGGCNE